MKTAIIEYLKKQQEIRGGIPITRLIDIEGEKVFDEFDFLEHRKRNPKLFDRMFRPDGKNKEHIFNYALDKLLDYEEDGLLNTITSEKPLINIIKYINGAQTYLFESDPWLTYWKEHSESTLESDEIETAKIKIYLLMAKKFIDIKLLCYGTALQADENQPFTATENYIVAGVHDILDSTIDLIATNNARYSNHNLLAALKDHYAKVIIEYFIEIENSQIGEYSDIEPLIDDIVFSPKLAAISLFFGRKSEAEFLAMALLLLIKKQSLYKQDIIRLFLQKIQLIRYPETIDKTSEHETDFNTTLEAILKALQKTTEEARAIIEPEVKKYEQKKSVRKIKFDINSSYGLLLKKTILYGEQFLSSLEHQEVKTAFLSFFSNPEKLAPHLAPGKEENDEEWQIQKQSLAFNAEIFISYFLDLSKFKHNPDIVFAANHQAIFTQLSDEAQAYLLSFLLIKLLYAAEPSSVSHLDKFIAKVGEQLQEQTQSILKAALVAGFLEHHQEQQRNEIFSSKSYMLLMNYLGEECESEFLSKVLIRLLETKASGEAEIRSFLKNIANRSPYSLGEKIKGALINYYAFKTANSGNINALLNTDINRIFNNIFNKLQIEEIKMGAIVQAVRIIAGGQAGNPNVSLEDFCESITKLAPALYASIKAAIKKYFLEWSKKSGTDIIELLFSAEADILPLILTEDIKQYCEIEDEDGNTTFKTETVPEWLALKFDILGNFLTKLCEKDSQKRISYIHGKIEEFKHYLYETSLEEKFLALIILELINKEHNISTGTIKALINNIIEKRNDSEHIFIEIGTYLLHSEPEDLKYEAPILLSHNLRLIFNLVHDKQNEQVRYATELQFLTCLVNKLVTGTSSDSNIVIQAMGFSDMENPKVVCANLWTKVRELLKQTTQAPQDRYDSKRTNNSSLGKVFSLFRDNTAENRLELNEIFLQPASEQDRTSEENSDASEEAPPPLERKQSVKKYKPPTQKADPEETNPKTLLRKNSRKYTYTR